jgi:hypothetical protein
MSCLSRRIFSLLFLVVLDADSAPPVPTIPTSDPIRQPFWAQDVVAEQIELPK